MKDANNTGESKRAPKPMEEMVSTFLQRLETIGADSSHPDDLRHRIEHIILQTVAFIDVIAREHRTEYRASLLPAILELKALVFAFHEVDSGRTPPIFKNPRPEQSRRKPALQRMLFDWMTSLVAYYQKAKGLSRAAACKKVADTLAKQGYTIGQRELAKIVEHSPGRKWRERFVHELASDDQANGLLNAIIANAKFAKHS